jgi:uncharacterized integral membrane protein
MADATPPGAAGPPAQGTAAPGSPWTAKRIALVALLAAGIVLALFNLDETNISFVFFDTKAPLFLVIVLSLVIGFLIGLVSRDVRSRRGSKKQP